MLTVDHALDLKAHAGQMIGTSRWVKVTQDAIDGFAHLSGDDHWIHVDTERAACEMPGGLTIAHGLYLLSLTPALQREIYRIRNRGRGLNYGYEKVRFISPVPVGSRVRLKQTVGDVAEHPRGARIEIDVEIEIEGSDRPAIVARHIILIENP